MNTVSSNESYIVGPSDRILITGAAGFIGTRLVANLLERGFRNLRCLVRPSNRTPAIEALSASQKGCVEILRGNLVSPTDCDLAATGAEVVFHLAAGRGQKSFADAFLNSVVSTRNLLEACSRHRSLRRFVNVSSFSVYTNRGKRNSNLLDESCAVERSVRGDAYSFAKVRQDEIVAEYGERLGLPYVIVRPGYVYGPGKSAISGRIGTDTFGLFLHFGGSNPLPFTYVDNCADAIALAGLMGGVDGETFNIVDDDLPSSREFLRQYKRKVKRFPSIYIPHALSYAFCWLWHKYSNWSEGQLPPTFSPAEWHAYWKRTYYSNEKVKSRLGWIPKISTAEGLKRFFQASRDRCHA